jgi:hypothetical protein
LTIGDPFELNNLTNDPGHAAVKAALQTSGSSGTTRCERGAAIGLAPQLP